MSEAMNVGEELDLFELANLYPDSTGLPMTVWVSPRNAAHDACVKVCRQHGNRMIPTDLVSVSTRPEPELLHGELPARDLQQVQAWVRLNQSVLLDYWDGRIDTVKMVTRLRRLD